MEGENTIYHKIKEDKSKSTSSNSSDDEKCLVVFDFDNTIINGDTYDNLLNLINEGKEENEKIDRENKTWAEFNHLLFDNFKSKGINSENIKKSVQSLEFNKNMKDVFKFINDNKERYTPIIITGSLKTLVHHIIEHNGFTNVIHEIFGNDAKVDSHNFFYYAELHKSKQCEECSFSICKYNILKDFLKNKKKFDRLIYVGDGMIDKCPCKILNEEDTLFPRMNFPLYEEIYTNGYINCLKCKVVPWSDGISILEHI